MKITAKSIAPFVGIGGLIYMLFDDSARDPILVVAFFAMIGIGPLPGFGDKDR